VPTPLVVGFDLDMTLLDTRAYLTIGSYRYYDWGTFLWMWNVLDGMSLAVAPA